MRRRYLWLIFFIPFGLTFIKSLFSFNSFLSTLQNEVVKNISGDNSFVSFGFNSLIKFSVIPIMICTITVYETHFPNVSLNLKKNISLSKLRFSKGKKFADIWYFFLNILFNEFPILITFLTFGISNFSQNINKPIEILFKNFYQLFLPNLESGTKGLILVILTILLTDFMNYARHRLDHKVPLFWDLHEFHHSATEMTILSRYRGLPIENIFTAPIFLPLSVFTGLLLNLTLSSGFPLPLIIYSMYVAYTSMADLISHSSSKIIYPRKISKIFMSPALHLLHHSANPQHFDKNFGQFITLWDKIFGTYLDESHLKNIKEFGVKNTQYNKYHPLYSISVVPLTKISRRIKNLCTN